MQKRLAVWSGYLLHTLRHGAGRFMWQHNGRRICMAWEGLQAGRACEGNRHGGLVVPLGTEGRSSGTRYLMTGPLRGDAARRRGDMFQSRCENNHTVQRNSDVRGRGRGRCSVCQCLLPLTAGPGLDDLLLRPRLPHVRAAAGNKGLPGPFLRGQVLDGGAGIGKEEVFGNKQSGLGAVLGFR